MTMTNRNPIDLSIVVAVYNAARFLPAFLDSLVAQEPRERREIIVVNDGSTDDSASIATDYQRRYPEIVMVHQENGGVSVARNTGMAMARGRYLAFPDADDILLPGMYRTLLSAALEDDLDIVTCNGFYRYDDDRPERLIFPDSVQTTGVITGADWLRRGLRSRRFLHVTWLNLYRREFIEANGFQFEPGLGHQDIPWTTELLLKAERVRYLSMPFYKYLLHKSSVSHLPSVERKVKTARCYMQIVELLENINRRYAGRVPIFGELHWQITKEGLGILHGIRGLSDRKLRIQLYAELVERGIFRLLWRNARGLRQHIRLLKRVPRVFYNYWLSTRARGRNENKNHR